MQNISLSASSLCLCFSPSSHHIPTNDTTQKIMNKNTQRRLHGAKKINVTLKQTSKYKSSNLNEYETNNKKFSVIAEGACVSQAIKMVYDRSSNKLKTKMKDQSLDCEVSSQKQEIPNEASFANEKKSQIFHSDHQNENLSNSLKNQFWQVLFGDSQKLRKTLSTENEQLYHSQQMIKKENRKNQHLQHSMEINKNKNNEDSSYKQNIKQTFLNVPKLDVGSMTFSKIGDISFMTNKESNFDLLETEIKRLLSQ